MSTRMTPHSAAAALALTLLGALATASVWMDSATQEIAVAPAIVGIDIPALTATAGTDYMPLLSVHDPI